MWKENSSLDTSHFAAAASLKSCFLLANLPLLQDHAALNCRLFFFSLAAVKSSALFPGYKRSIHRIFTRFCMHTLQDASGGFKIQIHFNKPEQASTHIKNSKRWFLFFFSSAPACKYPEWGEGCKFEILLLYPGCGLSPWMRCRDRSIPPPTLS